MTVNVDVSVKAQGEVKKFHYEKPSVNGQKETLGLAKTNYGILKLQVLNEGGENNLHSHPSLDGFWFVLKGRVRLYTNNDELVAELGENEGFSTPRRYRYWFESVPGPVDLELLQFHASTIDLVRMAPGDSRVNHSRRKANQLDQDQPVVL